MGGNVGQEQVVQLKILLSDKDKIPIIDYMMSLPSSKYSSSSIALLLRVLLMI